MERVYLGQVEKGIDKVMVYYNEAGYEIDFFSNDNLMANCELYDDDHVLRELEHYLVDTKYIEIHTSHQIKF